MNTRIVYIDPISSILAFLTIPPDMFDANSTTRELLASRGITFETDQDVVNWVQNQDTPGGVTSYQVPAANFPLTANNRDSWTYDVETNSVIGS